MDLNLKMNRYDELDIVHDRNIGELLLPSGCISLQVAKHLISSLVISNAVLLRRRQGRIQEVLIYLRLIFGFHKLQSKIMSPSVVSSLCCCGDDMEKYRKLCGNTKEIDVDTINWVQVIQGRNNWRTFVTFRLHKPESQLISPLVISNAMLFRDNMIEYMRLCRWEDNIKVVFKEIGVDTVNWVELIQDRNNWRILVTFSLHNPKSQLIFPLVVWLPWKL